MTKYIPIIVLLCLVVVPASFAQYRANDELHASRGAQLFDDPARVSPNRTESTSLGDLDIVLEWGAPSVRGRLVSGGLVSTYKVWRTGANEATTIHFSEDVLVEGEPLAAGTYSLFTIGGKKKWTFIFNSDAQQWGAFTYDRKKDVLRVKVDPQQLDHQEELFFSFLDASDQGTTMQLRWGTTGATVALELDGGESRAAQ